MDGRLAISICENKRELIRHFYELESKRWHETVHENGGTVQENIDDSLRSISEDSVMYEVVCGHETAAMFNKTEDERGNLVMECFHVAKEFRTKEFFKEFWKAVKQVFEYNFMAGLYEQNKDAVNHFIKNGFEEIGETVHRNKKIILFKICQFPQP